MKNELAFSMPSMVESFAKNLDNCTGNGLYLDYVPCDSSPEKGEVSMKQIRKRVQVGTDEQGKPVYKWASGHSEQEFLQNALSLMLEAGTISAKHPEKSSEAPMFNDFARDWFENVRKPTVKNQRFLEGRGLLQNYIYPFFEGKRIDEIRPSDITKYFSQSRIQKLATSTAGNHGELLGMIFDFAIEDEIIKDTPMKNYKKHLPKRKQERKPLSVEEVQAIIKALPELRPDDHLLLSVYLFTGLRRGEALAIQRKDIDLDKMQVMVTKAVHFIHNQAEVGETKSEAGRRIVPLLDGFPVDLLEGLKPDDYILGGGKPWTESKYKRTFERIKKMVDLHNATGHVFRHTYATFALEKGIDPKTVQGLLGHETPSTTLGIYAHINKARVAEAGKQLNGMYGA